MKKLLLLCMICIAAPQLLVVATGKSCYRGEGLRNIVLDSGRCENFVMLKTDCQDLGKNNVAFFTYGPRDNKDIFSYTSSTLPPGCISFTGQYDTSVS